MNDRAVGLFEDEGEAESAMESLVGSGVEADRMTIKRVLQPGHRGFADSETVHSLIHAPEVHEGDHVSDDAGTVILIVEILEQSEDEEDVEKANPLNHDNEAVMAELAKLGATETRLVEATPPLDL